MAITPNDLQAKSAGGFGTVAHGIITLLRQWYSSGITILAGFTGTTLTLSGAAPATPTANVLYKDGIPKALVNFNGTGTVAIRWDFNVSSLVDNGVGFYTVNLATSMADASFVVTSALNYPAPGTDARVLNFTVSSFDMITVNGAVQVDAALICASVFGNQ